MRTATLSELNARDLPGFVDVCGPLFESSPWIAERTWPRRPFASIDVLHRELVATVDAATESEKIRLIAAHPDLVGRMAREGALSSASSREQKAAGLGELSAQEIARFEAYNRDYRVKFGFPFVICARENRKEAILAAFPGAPCTLARAGSHRCAFGDRKDCAPQASRRGDGGMRMARLAENSYGKSDVRLTKVVRKGAVHSLFELTVGIMLGGAFEPVYTEGDNSLCIPTDTMKNTVYALAKKQYFDSPGILWREFLPRISWRISPRWPGRR